VAPSGSSPRLLGSEQKFNDPEVNHLRGPQTAFEETSVSYIRPRAAAGEDVGELRDAI
jgi:hypothetical protein